MVVLPGEAHPQSAGTAKTAVMTIAMIRWMLVFFSIIPSSFGGSHHEDGRTPSYVDTTGSRAVILLTPVWFLELCHSS